MKNLRLALSILVAAALAGSSWAQRPVQSELVVTITDYDYSVVNPDIGIVSGTYTYHFSYKLSKEGYIEGIHWNANHFNLWNQNGDKIIVIDSGHDTYGFLWGWYNTPAYMNNYDPGIIYSCADGWLDPLMPDEMPVEGISVNMSVKIMCKGSKFRMPFLAIFHVNANGVQTVEMIKP